MSLSVLLPTDGSFSALKAARWLGAHLKPEGIVVTILHVMAPRVEYGKQGGLIHARDESEKVLEDTERALGCCPSVNTVSIIGVPQEEIVRYAVDHSIDLIVMGRRGHSEIGHWIGSVSFAVFQRSPIPVTIVEPDQ
ncbi:MAG: universal stress protein [Thermaerobacter sp.]|nr:universal stress protein [Thermaerobacter sp.]